MMQNTPVSLEAAGTKWILDDTPGEEYVVNIPDGTHVAVCFGEDARKPVSHFTHPNLAATQERLHEFKHDRPSGSKFWTASAGVAVIRMIVQKLNTWLFDRQDAGPAAGY